MAQTKTALQSLKTLTISILLLIFTFSIVSALNTPPYVKLFHISDSLTKARNYIASENIGYEILDSVAVDRQISDSLRASIFARVGSILYNSGDYNKSESLYVNSIEIRTRLFGRNHLETVESNVGLANIYNIRAVFDKAESLYSHALKIRENSFGENHEIVIETIRLIGQLQKNLGNLNKAKEYFLRGLVLAESNDNPNFHMTPRMLNELAILSSHQENMNELVRYAKRVINLSDAKEGVESISSTRARIRFASWLAELGEYNKALSIIDSLSSVINIDSSEGLYLFISTTRTKARIYLEKGDFPKADSLYIECINNLPHCRGDKRYDIAICQRELANLYLKQYKFRDAENLLKSAIDLTKDYYWFRNNITNLVEPITKLAHLYLSQGRYSDAEALFNEAIEIRIKRYGADNSLVAEKKLDLSYAFAKQGKLEDAEKTIRNALNVINTEYGLIHEKTLIAIQKLANILQEKGNYEESERLYRQVLAGNSQLYGSQHLKSASSKLALGECLKLQNHFAEALDLYNEVLEIYSNFLGEDHPQYATAITKIAEVYVAANDYDIAIIQFSRALAIFQNSFSNAHPEISKIHLKLARAYASLEEISNTIKQFELYLASRQKLRDFLFLGANEEQKLRWMQEFPPIDNSLVAIALETQSQELIALTTSMLIDNKAATTDAVLTERETAFCSSDSTISLILSDLGQFSTVIANYAFLIANNQAPSILLDSITALINIRDSLEAELSQRCSEFGNRSSNNIDLLEQIVQALDDDEIMIQYIKHKPYTASNLSQTAKNDEYHYTALLLNSNKDMNIIDLGEAQYIDSLILLVREMIYESRTLHSIEMFKEHEISVKKLLALLYKKVVEPIILKARHSRSIIISPDGQLNLLPFEILVQNNQYFIENYKVQYVSSGKDFIREHKNTNITSKQIAIFADPDFDLKVHSTTPSLAISSNVSIRLKPFTEHFSLSHNDCLPQKFTRLHNTRTEAQQISDVFGSILGVNEFIGKKASEEAIKGLSIKPEIIHIATHGFSCISHFRGKITILNHPMLKSGLILAGANQYIASDNINYINEDNGIFTAYEASNLNLVGTKLVTLSTCESGLGLTINGEGILGLRRAFRHTGAENIIMSLWEVPDLETSQLMAFFYKNWIAGLPFADALREASLTILNDIRSKYNHGHPVFWGGFVLARNYGDNQ